MSTVTLSLIHTKTFSAADCIVSAMFCWSSFSLYVWLCLFQFDLVVFVYAHFLRCLMILLCCVLSLVKTNCTSFSFLCFRLRCLTICDCSIPQKYHGPLGRALSFVSLKWIKNYFTLFGEYLFHHFIQFFLLTTSHNLPLKKSKKKKTRQKNQKNMHDHMATIH